MTSITRFVTSKKHIQETELKVIIIDKTLMISSELFYQVRSRLIEIFDCKTDEPLAGIPIIV